MFKLLNIRLINWKFFPNHYESPVYLHKSVNALIGENGSGKTTFIDGLRTVFGETRFSRGRKLKDYVRPGAGFCVLQVEVSNPSKNSREKIFSQFGIENETVSICCHIVKKGSKFERTYYVVGGAFNYNTDRNKDISYSPTEYKELMSRVGLSSSLSNILTLEQGETDKICNKDPQKLFETVLMLCGEKSTLDDYESSKIKFFEEQKSFFTLNKQLDAEKNELKLYEFQKNEFLAYKERVKEKDNAKMILPISKAKEYILNLNKLIKQKKELDEEVIFFKNKESSLISEIETLTASFNEKDSLLKELELEKQKILTKKVKLEERKNNLEKKVNNKLKPFIDEVAQIKPIPIIDLENEIKSVTKDFYRISANCDDLKSKSNALRNKIADIEKNNSLSPEIVENFKQDLSGLEFFILYEAIEVIDKENQLFVETILNDDRYTIIVKPEHYLEAKKIANSSKYPFKISPYFSKEIDVNEHSILSKIKIKNQFSIGWLSWLNNIYISDNIDDGHKLSLSNKSNLIKNGFFQGKDYAIWIDPGFYCIGEIGKEIQLKLYNDDLLKCLEQIKRLGIKKNKFKEQLNQLQSDLTTQRKVELLDQKKLELKECLDTISDLNSQYLIQKDFFEKKKSEYGQTLTKRDELQNSLTTNKSEINHIREKYDEKKKFQIELMSKIDEDERNKHLIFKEINTDEETVLLMDIKDSRFYNDEIIRLNNNIVEFESKNIPDGIERLYENKKNRIFDLEEKLHEKRISLDEWKKKTEISYVKYVEYIENLFYDYKREFKNLTSLIDATGDVILSKKGESSWELMIRVGFDGKELLNYDDANLSGGQSVIVSTLVLLAAIRFESAFNFVMIDEHAAHLDFWKTKKVGKLLHMTGAQYILTAPEDPKIEYTEWINQCIFLSIKPKDKDFTKPIHIIRKKEYENDES